MAAVTLDAEAPGKSALRPVLVQAPRVIKFVTGTFAFDSSYPTGGESISDIFDQFNNVSGTSQLLGVLFESAGGYTFGVDYSGKKVLAYWVDTSTDGAAQAEVVDTTNLATLTAVRFIAWGYR